MALKTLVLIGVIATVGVYFTVRIFPKQEYPEDNAKTAAFGFCSFYILSLFNAWVFLALR